MQGLERAVRSVVSAACLSGMMLLAGCSNFFLCQKASCPNSGGGGTTATKIAYVANGTSGQTYIAGYDISKGALTATTSSPYGLGITPTAMVVSQSNKFLYAGSTASASVSAGIYGWSIGSTGAISVLNSGNALASQSTVGAMDVSPDGQWLLVANSIDGTQPTIIPYKIDSSSGLLTASTALVYAAPTGSTLYTMKVAPSGQYVALAMSTGGVLIFPFNTSTGVLGSGSTITFSSPAVGAYDLAIDSNNYLYIASTGNVVAYAVSSAGIPGGTSVSTAATATTGPFSIAVDGTNYVYAGANNGTSNLIYGFSTNKGVLTALSTPTIAGPAGLTKLAVDSTQAYLLAAGYDTSAGLRIYSISSSGILSSAASAGTGTTTGVATAIATTH